MAVFKYIALDEEGKSIKGLQEAENQKHARQLLRDQALIVTSLVSTTKPTKQKWFVRNITTKALSLYVQQLAMMLRSGLPIEFALSILVDQTQHPKDKIIWTTIKSAVNEGIELSESMKEFPQSFPNFLIASVASGEHSGRLDAVLTNVSETLIKKNKFSSQVGNALIYPVVISFVAFSVIVALLTFVMPQIIDVFTQLDKELPDLTIALIAISDFIRLYINQFIIIFIAFIIIIKWVKRTNKRRRYWDKLWLKIPLISGISREIEAIKFMRTLSTLLEGGVVMVEAINHSLASLDNIIIQERMIAANQKINEGKSVSVSFESVKLFNSMSLQLIHLGETTGELDQTLKKTTDMLEENLTQRINTALSLFEPALILVMGILVLIIVLAILLPIFDLNQAL